MTKPPLGPCLARVIDVSPVEDGGCAVAFYVRDALCQDIWTAGEGAPEPGDLYLWEPKTKTRRKIAAADPALWRQQAGGDALRWRRPGESGLSRMEVLRRRHLIKRAVRQTLHDKDYIEIDAPLLVRGTTPDVAVATFDVGGGWNLAPSTEYQLKRMAVGGFENLYSLTQNFRKDDRAGLTRNPEFTMLEWGRVGGTMREVEADLEDMTRAAAAALGLGEDSISYQGRRISLKGPFPRVPVAQAIETATGETFGGYEAVTCLKALGRLGVDVRPEWGEDRDLVFGLLMDAIQPTLGLCAPVFLVDWPMFQTSSASLAEDGMHVNRSELYVAGIEISDGFGGLADPALQAHFFGAMQAARAGAGLRAVPLDENYLGAMRLGAPFGAGMAMGFDRFVMLLTDQPSIRSVLALAWDEL